MRVVSSKVWYGLSRCMARQTAPGRIAGQHGFGVVIIFIPNGIIAYTLKGRQKKTEYLPYIYSDSNTVIPLDQHININDRKLNTLTFTRPVQDT